jgi:hypothetical protein
MTINELSQRVTGMDWTILEKSLKGGYVPTLRPHSGRGRDVKDFNKVMEELGTELEKRGYRVFRGLK